MSKVVVVDGDSVTFEPSFGDATIVPVPTTISGSGTKLKSGATVCVDGDEANVSKSNVSYTTSAFTIQGTGTLTIKQLNSDQKAQKLTIGSKAAILVGSKFDATLKVDSPASNSNQADIPNTTYSGKGQFVSSNTKLDSA